MLNSFLALITSLDASMAKVDLLLVFSHTLHHLVYEKTLTYNHSTPT